LDETTGSLDPEESAHPHFSAYGINKLVTGATTRLFQFIRYWQTTTTGVDYGLSSAIIRSKNEYNSDCRHSADF
jgi:hypothetical protein